MVSAKSFSIYALLIAFLIQGPTFARGETVVDWRAALSEGDRRMLTQELVAAEDQYRAAVNGIKRDPSASVDDRVLCTQKLAGVLQIEDLTHDALPLYKRSLKMLEKHYGRESVQIWPTLKILGRVYEGEGDYSLAAEYYRRSGDIVRANLGENSYVLAELLQMCARATFKSGLTLEAEALYRTSLSIIMHQSDIPDRRVLESLLSDYNDLLRKKDAQGRVADSTFQHELLKDKVGSGGRTRSVASSAFASRVRGSVMISPQGLETPGAVNSPNAGQPLSTLESPRMVQPFGTLQSAGTVQSLGTLQSAGTVPSPSMVQPPVAVQPQPVSEMPHSSALGAPEPGTSLARNPFDPVALDRLSKQRVEFYERMVAVDIRTLGPKHPSVARDLSGLAAVHIAERHYDQARPLLARALEIYQSVYGNDHPLIRQTQELLALVSERQEAIRRNGTPAVDDSFVATLPAVPPHAQALEVSLRLNYLALQCYSQHNFDDALRYYAWAASVTVAACGTQDPLVAACLMDYGRVLRSVGQSAKAETYDACARSILSFALAKQAAAALP